MPYRDDNLICIELGSYETRSIFGLAESLGPAANRTRTRVGKRKDTDLYICGDDLTSILANEAEQIDIYNPVVCGHVSNWEALAAFFEHLLFVLAKEEPGTKDSEFPVILIVPPQWSLMDKDRATKMFIEQLSRPAFMIVETAAASLYACNAMTGLVVDVGHEKTDVTSIVDSVSTPSSCITVPIGGRHLSESFRTMLLDDRPLDQTSQLAIEAEQITVDLAEAIKRSEISEIRLDSKSASNMAFQADPVQGSESADGVLDIAAVVASGKTREYLARVQAEKDGVNGGAQDVVPNAQLTHNTVNVDGRILVVGRDRFRIGDMLLEGTELSDAIYNAIMNPTIDPARRRELWENIVVVGGGSRVKGFREKLIQTLQSRYGSVLVQATNDLYAPTLFSTYPTTIRAIKIPVHFPEWTGKDVEVGGQKGDNEEATFLGGCIVAHIAFASSETGSARLYVTKADYDERGPVPKL